MSPSKEWGQASGGGGSSDWGTSPSSSGGSKQKKKAKKKPEHHGGFWHGVGDVLHTSERLGTHFAQHALHDVYSARGIPQGTVHAVSALGKDVAHAIQVVAPVESLPGMHAPVKPEPWHSTRGAKGMVRAYTAPHTMFGEVGRGLGDFGTSLVEHPFAPVNYHNHFHNAAHAVYAHPVYELLNATGLASLGGSAASRVSRLADEGRLGSKAIQSERLAKVRGAVPATPENIEKAVEAGVTREEMHGRPFVPGTRQLVARKSHVLEDGTQVDVVSKPVYQIAAENPYTRAWQGVARAAANKLPASTPLFGETNRVGRLEDKRASQHSHGDRAAAAVPVERTAAKLSGRGARALPYVHQQIDIAEHRAMLNETRLDANRTPQQRLAAEVELKQIDPETHAIITDAQRDAPLTRTGRKVKAAAAALRVSEPITDKILTDVGAMTPDALEARRYLPQQLDSGARFKEVADETPLAPRDVKAHPAAAKKLGQAQIAREAAGKIRRQLPETHREVLDVKQVRDGETRLPPLPTRVDRPVTAEEGAANLAKLEAEHLAELGGAGARNSLRHAVSDTVGTGKAASSLKNRGKVTDPRKYQAGRHAERYDQIVEDLTHLVAGTPLARLGGRALKVDDLPESWRPVEHPRSFQSSPEFPGFDEMPMEHASFDPHTLANDILKAHGIDEFKAASLSARAERMHNLREALAEGKPLGTVTHDVDPIIGQVAGRTYRLSKARRAVAKIGARLDEVMQHPAAGAETRAQAWRDLVNKRPGIGVKNGQSLTAFAHYLGEYARGAAVTKAVPGFKATVFESAAERNMFFAQKLGLTRQQARLLRTDAKRLESVSTLIDNAVKGERIPRYRTVMEKRLVRTPGATRTRRMYERMADNYDRRATEYEQRAHDIAKPKRLELEGGTPIEELKAAAKEKGIEPGYWPHTQRAARGVLRNVTGAKRGESAVKPTMDVKHNEGTAYQTGRYDRSPDNRIRSIRSTLRLADLDRRWKRMWELAPEVDVTHLPASVHGAHSPYVVMTTKSLREFAAVRENVASGIETVLELARDSAMTDLEAQRSIQTLRESLLGPLPKGAQGKVRVLPREFVRQYTAEFDAASPAVHYLLDKPTTFFKTMVLKLRPMWMLGNIVGNTTMMLVVDPTPAGIRAYAQQLAAHGKDTKLVNKFVRNLEGSPELQMTYLNVIDKHFPALRSSSLLATQTGRLGSTWAKLARDERRSLLTQRFAKVLQRGMEIPEYLADLSVILSDDVTRAARAQRIMAPAVRKAMSNPRYKGWSQEAIANDLLERNPRFRDHVERRALDDLIDYGGLSHAERKYLRRVIPFYSWLRGFTVWTAEQSAWKLAAAAATGRQGERDFEAIFGKGNVPDYVLNSIMVGKPHRLQDGTMGQRTLPMQSLAPGGTIADVADIAAGTLGLPGVGGRKQAMLHGAGSLGSALNPVLSAPLEVWTGNDFFTGQAPVGMGGTRGTQAGQSPDGLYHGPRAITNPIYGPAEKLLAGLPIPQLYAKWRSQQQNQRNGLRNVASGPASPYASSFRDYLLQYMGVPGRTVDIDRTREYAIRDRSGVADRYVGG